MLLILWRKKTAHSSIQHASKKRSPEVDEGRLLRAVVLVLLFVLPPGLMASDKHSESFLFDIPRQRADLSLIQFAEQADLTLIVPFDQVQKKVSNRLVGQYNVEEAIKILLLGTGLDGTVSEDGQLSIVINQYSGEGEKEMTIPKKSRRSFLAGLTAFLASALAAPAAVGQETTGNSAGALEEVVVTAQRREQSVQDVPISLTAFTADDLDKQNILGSADYLQFTPNVNFTEDGEGGRRGLTLAIRGVGNTTDNEISTTNSYGFYVDELNVASSANIVINPQLTDVERIEVLRGPQGTFFGRNASGGAFNITTKKPEPDFYGEVSGFGQRFGHFGGSGIINVPLSDKLFFRGSFSHERGDGAINNIAPTGNRESDFEFYHFRGAFRYLVNDRVTLDFSYDRVDENQNLEENVPSGVIALSTLPRVQGCTNALNAARQCAVNPGGAGFFPDNRRTTAKDYPDVNDNNNETFNFRITWETDQLTFKSITGYMESTSVHNFDLDGTADSILVRTKDRDAESFSQEFRVHSNAWEKLDLVAGVIYANDEFSAYREVFAGNLGFGPYSPNNIVNASSNDFEIESWAVFLDGTWSVTDKLDLIAGIRYSDDSVDVGLSRRLAGNRGPVGGETPLPDLQTRASFDDVSFRAVANYHYTDDVMFYGLVSTGYKAGGSQLNDPVGNIGENTPYDEEKVTNYEIGFKSTLFDRRLRLNVAAFLIDWEDLQVESQVFDPVTLNAAVIVQNAAKAENWGMELEFLGVLTDRITIGGGFGYLDSEFKRFDNADVSGNLVDVSGLRVPQTPKWTTNIHGEYRFPFMNNLEGWGRIEHAYRDETRTNLEAVAQSQLGLPDLPYRIPSYNVVNLRAGIDAADWSITAYLKNLFDENYYTGIREDFGFAGIKLRPHFREFGIKVSKKFF